MSGCSCSDNERPDGTDGGPDADAAGDATMVDSMLPDGSSGCDEETGVGCPCPGEGETRACEADGVGACGTGTQTCTSGLEFPVWGPCGDAPEPSAEECNGVDDDCDGETDEELGEITCGSGVCVNTVDACLMGVPQTCVPGTGADEECNGEDDDCDEMVDEGFADLTCGSGACEVTVAACVDGAPQECTPGEPSAEECNGIDDDCDGTADEGLGMVTCGTGACEVTVAACVDGTPATCTPGEPSAEECNGIDDDCNGTIDDGFGTTVCGVGECETVVLDCDGGGGGTCTPGEPSEEVCDGLDNDCDGETDEAEDIPDLSCGVGACARTQDACVGGEPQTCDPGVPSDEACNGVDDDCDGETDEDLGTRTCGRGACQVTVEACVDGTPQSCEPLEPGTEVCDGSTDEDCDGTVDEGCDCDPTKDVDFDGVNECSDCDDTNGAVYPGQTETCDGVDEDCDGEIDEDFDADGDGFSTCSDDPLLRDCDDTLASVNPEAPEACGADGTGNGIDDNCNGFTDETCDPCDDVDDDGDGASECDGDCDDTDDTVSPTAAEACDGVDTDCNVFTTKNCDVSDPCNFDSGADVCRDDLLCGCVVGPSGRCQDEYICTSFCEGSFTGALGSGCTDTQTCLYRITPSDNQHGCGETTETLGSVGAGEMCSADSECRSGDCDQFPCIGPGCDRNDYCQDFCSHHDPGADGSCAPGTVCELIASRAMDPFMFAACRPDDNGAVTTGGSCADGASCLWGSESCVNGTCAEPCALDAHCPAGTHCSLEGNTVEVGTWSDTTPVDGETALETVPVCLPDTGSGLHDRQAGAACSQNGDCISQFCDASRNVCVSLCTTDGSCPSGLSCESQWVRSADGVVRARICVTAPSEEFVYEAL